MAQMLDMIRNSQVPSNLMQSAARGALSVAPDENMEILVYLASHHKLFGEQARMTLAGWDENASIAAAADPNTSAEVLAYLAAAENLRTCLLPALAGNPSVSEDALDALAASGSRVVVDALLQSDRVMSSRRTLQALQTNSNLRPNELTEIADRVGRLEEASNADTEIESAVRDEEVESTLAKFMVENSAELAVVQDKPFQPASAAHEESSGGAVGEAAENVEPDVPAVAAVSANAEKSASGLQTHAMPVGGTAAAVAPKAKTPIAAVAVRRDSTLQKISKLDIRGRIALAMRGNKEERSILIRDSTKLVSLAVLDSPKVSDAEVEKFALQKNVLQAVLRAIPMKRKFAKNYGIMRNLVYNPRTPLDLSLTLMKNLLLHDLKNLSGNKEVSDTIRKVALRMYRQKNEKKG